MFCRPLHPEELVKKIDEIEQIINRMGIPQEISHQNRVEEALTMARQELADTIRLQQGMIFKYIEKNGAFIHTLCDGELMYRMGLIPEQVINKELADLLPLDVAEEKRKYYQKAWEGEDHVTYEGMINDVWYLTSLRPIQRGGKVVEVIGSCIDITERKKMDEFIRKIEKLSVAGQLAAGVAHEIRNPLTTVKGFLQLMQKESDISNYRDIILSELDNVEKVVQGLLSLAKPHVNKISPTDISVLLQHVVTLINTQAVLQNVVIIIEVDPELPSINCDEHQIKQVFVNILQNSIEAMPNGGIIKIQTMRYDLDKIKFRFIDQGCGIPEKRMKSIGEPYYSIKEKGTGLGLMISHKIIQEHRGTINIKSTVNQGTTVEVILPMEQQFDVTA